jgi:hypothetical protein
MGIIRFEGGPPFEPLYARSPTVEPTLDGVELVLNIYVGEPDDGTVPVRIRLEPEDARLLAAQVGPRAVTVEQWRRRS